MNWYACRTRARAEKNVDRLLAGAGIESYLPLIERERQWTDRRMRIAYPLFPGYVFARFKLTELYEVLRTPGLVTVVRLNGDPTPVRDEELESIRALVKGANHTGAMPSFSDRVAPGQEVVVIGGPFQGMRGTLLRTRGNAQVVVRLSAIRFVVGVEMDRRFLRPNRR
ncbi:MAG: UpxY family transcription antiterminator [Gemmatimonadota bacterium]